VVLMGKNTMMRNANHGHLEENPDLERMEPHIKQNVGFKFTKMELLHVRDLLLKAPAKAGALVP
jgi:large subunit ribosomal protein LP0